MIRYVTGVEPEPKALPAMYQLGSKEEAQLCRHWLGPAWKAHKEALAWLRERYLEMIEGQPSL